MLVVMSDLVRRIMADLRHFRERERERERERCFYLEEASMPPSVFHRVGQIMLVSV